MGDGTQKPSPFLLPMKLVFNSTLRPVLLHPYLTAHSESFG